MSKEEIQELSVPNDKLQEQLVDLYLSVKIRSNEEVMISCL